MIRRRASLSIHGNEIIEVDGEDRAAMLKVVRDGIAAGVIVPVCTCSPKVLDDPEHKCPIDPDDVGFTGLLMRIPVRPLGRAFV